TVIVVGYSRPYLGTFFGDIEQAATITNSYGRRNYEHGQAIWISRSRLVPLDQAWPRLKALDCQLPSPLPFDRVRRSHANARSDTRGSRAPTPKKLSTPPSPWRPRRPSAHSGLPFIGSPISRLTSRSSRSRIRKG